MINGIHKIPSHSHFKWMKVGLTLGAICFSFGLGSYFYQQREQRTLNDTKYGINLCYARLAQGMIALQGQDYFSKNLERSYLDMTNECFFEFKETLIKNFDRDAQLLSLANQLVDQSVAYHKALFTLLSKRQEEIKARDIQSALWPQYTRVDYARYQVNQWVRSKEDQLSLFSSSLAILFAGCLLLGGMLLWMFWSLSNLRSWSFLVEKEAGDLLESQRFTQRSDYFLTGFFKELKLSQTLQLFLKYHDFLLQKQWNNSAATASTSSSSSATSLSISPSVSVPFSVEPAAHSFTDEDWSSELLEVSMDPQRTTQPQLERQMVDETMNTSQGHQYSNRNNNQSAGTDEFSFSLASHDLSETEADGELTQTKLISELSVSQVSHPNPSSRQQLEDFFQQLEKNWMNREQRHWPVTLSHNDQRSTAGIALKGSSELLLQLFSQVVRKLEQRFEDFDIPDYQRHIEVSQRFDQESGLIDILFTAKKVLFPIDDLEYFYQKTQSDQTSGNISDMAEDPANLLMREAVKELYGQISFRNLIGEELTDRRCHIHLQLPARAEMSSADADQGKISREVTLTNVGKVKKKDFKSLFSSNKSAAASAAKIEQSTPRRSEIKEIII